MPQSNAAYDFDRLEHHYAPAGAPHIKQPPELRVIENRSQRDRAAFWRSAVTFVLILGVVCAILYNNVQLTELTSQIEGAQNELESLVNDQRLMQVEIESKSSLRSVEEIAETQLGMAKVESYQVQYINLGEGDRVLLARAQEPGLNERLLAMWHSLLEYLGV